MNILFFLALLAAVGTALAQDVPDLVRAGGETRSGKSGKSGSSSKSSKSTDHPTLFPTLAPTLFPTLAPTYCGKSSKSGKSGRRLQEVATKDGVLRSGSSKSSKSSCYSGSRSRDGADREGPDGGYKILHRGAPLVGGGKGRDLEEEERMRKEESEPDFEREGLKVRRRRINVLRRWSRDQAEPSARDNDGEA